MKKIYIMYIKDKDWKTPESYKRKDCEKFTSSILNSYFTNQKKAFSYMYDIKELNPEYEVYFLSYENYLL